MPTIASYVLVAIVAAPVLVKMGVGLAQAHFFALYFAVIHYITPPIGTGALVASGIAGGKYLGTAWESFKIDLGAFVMPFIWIWTPALLLLPNGGLTWGAVSILVTALGLLALQIVVVGYYLTTVNSVERVVVALLAGGLFASIFLHSYMLLAIAVFVFIFFTLRQWRKRKLSTSLH